MGFVFFNLAICVNSILACLFLIYKNKRQQTTLFFAGLIISMCTIVSVGMAKDYFVSVYKYFVGIEFMGLFSMGALIYNYTLSNLGVYKINRVRTTLLTVPVILLGLFYIVYMVIPSNMRDAFYSRMMHIAASGPEYYVVVAFAYPALLSILANREVVRYKKQSQKPSETEVKHMLWLQRFNYCFVAIFSMAVISELISGYFPFCKYLYIVNLGIYSFYIYQLLVNPKIVFEPLKSKSFHVEPSAGLKMQGESKSESVVVIDYIEKEKPYLDTELSLVKLSDALQMSHIQLSQLLNQEMNINFNMLINSYRVKEACMKLTDPSFQNYTIESIGNISGFKSKAAFYDAFKRFTAQTPSEYRQQNLFHQA